MIPCVNCQFMFNCSITLMEHMIKRNETVCNSFEQAPDKIEWKEQSKNIKRMLKIE